MDAVAFPPPPAPFLDDDFDFGDFAFASPADPHPEPAYDDDWGDFVDSRLGSNPDGGSSAATAAAPVEKSSSSWEKPRGPLPLSLFGADDEEEAEEGPAELPPTAADQRRASHASSNGSKPADLKDLIAGLYGSQPRSSFTDAVEVGTQEGSPAAEEEDGDGFEDDGWEFKAAAPSSSDAGQDGDRRAHGTEKDVVTQDVPKSVGIDQEDWSLFTSVNENLNHVQTTEHVGTHESTGQSVKAFSYFPPNNAAILDLYKESEPIDAVHMMQSSSESVQSSSDMFSNTEMVSIHDENHSIKSASDRILIDFYHKLREESLSVISQYNKDLKDGQKNSMLSDEKNELAETEREIQEICKELQDSSLAKGLYREEHPSKDVCISELLNSAKEDHLKDFDQEYHLTETIARAPEDMSSAVKLYKHSVSILRTLELASKEEQCDYVSAWYSMLVSCAQELQHGVMIWKECCHANVCDTVISQGVILITLNNEQSCIISFLVIIYACRKMINYNMASVGCTGAHCFIALGEIYRVAQILHLSLLSFKPWVLADPERLSKMLVCWNNCVSSWTSGLGTALTMVVDSNNLDAPVAKVLLESIININEIEAPNLQGFLPSDKMACKLTLLPTNLVPGMEVTIWDGDHYFVKVANLWANRISSDPPQFSVSRVA
uniref:Synergin gamma C-terminal domain-containing protein n=1 Tax=Oryza punctata TaxID=4537 RepID=A0A0E0MCF7_ORYPU